MIRWALLLAALAVPLWAQTPGDDALAARSQLSAAARQLQAAGGARDQVRALTETVTAYESGLSALRDGMRQVSQREAELTAELNTQSGKIAELLGVLQTMGHAPAPVMLLHPDGPTGTARGGMLLAEVTPALHAEAETLRTKLEELQRLRALQDEAAGIVQEALSGAQSARIALSQAIDQRTDLPRRFNEDPVQTALLIASADSLDQFAGAMAEAAPGSADPAALEQKGSLAPPANGSILRPFRNRDASGVVRDGTILQTQPQTLVALSVPATLLFSGPLLDYGAVAVVEPAPDVLILMAGMEETYGNVGEIVPAGSPIGKMGGNLPTADAFLTSNADRSGANGLETLYIEVRENEVPVDPATWFAFEQ